MAHLFSVLTLLSTICGVLAEIQLVAGEEVTVTFTGPQLHIEVINHRTHGEYFVICFKSHPNNNARRCPIGYASFGPELMINMENPRLTDMLQFVLCLKSYPTTVQKYCPNGYASFYYWFVGQDRIRYRMTRYGTIVDGTASVIRGSVLFDYDGSVTIKVVKLPPGSYVHLVNAEKVIPTTTTIMTARPSTITTTEAVQKASYTLYYVISGLALLVVIIVGAMVAFICWTRNSKTTNDIEGNSKANVVKTEKSNKPTPPASSRKVSIAKNASHVKISPTQRHFEKHPFSGSEQSERSALK